MELRATNVLACSTVAPTMPGTGLIIGTIIRSLFVVSVQHANARSVRSVFVRVFSVRTRYMTNNAPTDVLACLVVAPMMVWLGLMIGTTFRSLSVVLILRRHETRGYAVDELEITPIFQLIQFETETDQTTTT